MLQHDLASGESDACWERFRTRFSVIVRDVIQFAQRIPEFTSLDLDDQISLIRGGAFEVGC